LFDLFVSRHEVHSMNTHTAERRPIKTEKQHVVQGIRLNNVGTLLAVEGRF